LTPPLIGVYGLAVSSRIHAPSPAEDEGEPFRLDLPGQEEMAIRARARLRAVQKSSSDRYRADPYRFLVECCWTLDQASQQVRRFPDIDDSECTCEFHCKNYVQHVINRWLREKRLLVPKSRRVLVSWTMVALHCWLARFFPGSTIAFVSRKQGLNDSEGAAELVRRVKFIEEHIPVEVEPIAFQYNFARLKYPSISSEIIGVAQGADQLRQYTLTAIFADEMAYWELAHDTYSASIPTLEGGGRFTGVSSANPGFFKQAVFDSL
jgi:hypothetical protein